MSGKSRSKENGRAPPWNKGRLHVMGSSCKCIVLIGNKVYGISHCCKSQVRSFDLCLVRGISACDIACIVTNMPRQSNNLRKTNFWVCEIPLLTATECNQLGQTVLYSITMRAWSLLYSEWAWTFSIAKKKKKKKRTMGLGSANYHIVRPCSLMPFFLIRLWPSADGLSDQEHDHVVRVLCTPPRTHW